MNRSSIAGLLFVCGIAVLVAAMPPQDEEDNPNSIHCEKVSHVASWPDG